MRRIASVVALVACMGTVGADDLPEGAASVLQQLDQDVTRVERAAEGQISDVMRQIYAIEDDAAEEARQLTVEAIDQLKMLQEQYTREGKLDEAVSVRDLIKSLEDELDGVEVVAAPTTLDYDDEVGQVFYYRLTGDADYGSVWGSDIYTYDSYIAVAAVHTGTLEDGESGIVKVTVLPGQESYVGEERHGVTSYSYGMYTLSYRIDLASPVVRAQVRQREMNAEAENEEP